MAKDSALTKPLTHEEHQTRAMLMGMTYHDGNGFGLYYGVDNDGVIDPTSFIDADTLEPLVPQTREQVMYHPRSHKFMRK